MFQIIWDKQKKTLISLQVWVKELQLLKIKKKALNNKSKTTPSFYPKHRVVHTEQNKNTIRLLGPFLLQVKEEH